MSNNSSSPSSLNNKEPKKFEISQTLIIPPLAKDYTEIIKNIKYNQHELFEFDQNTNPYHLLINSIKAGGPSLILLAILFCIVYVGTYIIWGLGVTFYYEALNEKELCNIPLSWLLVQIILTISMLLIIATIFIMWGFGKFNGIFLLLVSAYLLFALITFAWLCHGTSLYLTSSYIHDYNKCYNTFHGTKLINYIRVWILISWITGILLTSYFITFFIITLCCPKRFHNMYEHVGKFIKFDDI